MKNKSDSKTKIRLVLCGIVCFFVLIALMTGMLVAVAKIPKETIRPQVAESAEFLCERTQFGEVIIGKKSSMISRFADAVLLSIAWYYDENEPLTSVMWSNFYNSDELYSNESLAESVTKNVPPDKQYLRYWHGSVALIRPLLIWFSVRGIYIINAALMALLTVVLLFILLRKRAFAPVGGLLAGLVAVSAWFVPFSMEFIPTFLLMLIYSIIAWECALHEKTKLYGIMFMIFGMFTSYFDFLTTETLTLTVPLLLILYLEKEDAVRLTIKNSICWLIGYAGAWSMKWVIASLVLKENAMPYVTEHIAERLGGADNTPDNLFVYIFEAVFRNIKLLLPLEYGVTGLMIGIGLILLYLYLIFVYREKGYDKRRVIALCLIALIPYVRYMVLHNHAYLHSHFTYRAQLSSILALILIMRELKVFDKIRRLHDHGRR